MTTNYDFSSKFTLQVVLQYEETISNLITNNKEAKTKLEEEIQKLQVNFKLNQGAMREGEDESSIKPFQ